MRCPTCGKQDEVADQFRWRPFCSRRCKMIDLGNWLGEVYRFSRPIDSGDVQDDPALISHLMASTREH